MPFFKFSNIRIAGIASAVPTNVVELASFFPVFSEKRVNKFINMTGINQFRRATKHQTVSDFGFVASEKLIESMNISRNEIGAVVFGSHSPDYRRPATSCILQKRLRLSTNCAALDINLGCSSFVYGVNAICSLMSNSDINKAILVVGETISKIISQKDPSVAMLFGDAGSAILFEKTEDLHEISGLLRTDGNQYKTIIAPAGGFRNLDTSQETSVWSDGVERTLYNINMNGTVVFEFSITEIPLAVMDFFKLTNTSIDSYDCFVFHQANKFIHNQIARKTKIPIEQMPLSIDRYGNTSGASIPLTLCDYYGNTHGKMIHTFMCGFGVGFSWGIVNADICTDYILPIIETDEVFSEGIINSPDQL